MKIFLKVKPRASQAKVIKIDKKHYQVYITQSPEKGKANKQIIKLLADYFGVSLSKINIIAGKKRREKVVKF